MGSMKRQCCKQALVGNGSPGTKSPDQETLKGSTLHQLTTGSDDTIRVERVTMITCDCVSQYLGIILLDIPHPGKISAGMLTLNVIQTVTFGSDV